LSSATFVKIPAKTAVEVFANIACAHVELTGEALALLKDGMSPEEFLAALMEKKLYVDGFEFLAFALPVREAIWWGLLCMQHSAGDNLSPTDRGAASAAVNWLLQPTEENRVAAGPAAEAAGIASPAGSIAAAVFNTGGNVAPPGLQIFKAPDKFAPAKAIARAVTIASVKVEPVHIISTQKSYLTLGLEVAAGNHI
jgi:hypothetical protein